MKTVLETLVEAAAAFPRLTDIHMTEGAPVRIRLCGNLRIWEEEISDFPDAALALLSEEKKEIFEETGAADTAVSAGGHRFRLHIYRAGGTCCAAFRLLPETGNFPKDPDEDWMFHVKQYPSGLVLVTGPTGSGKTTTLAHIIEDINQNKPCHIVTVEDPAEYAFTSEKALIHQREIGTDVSDFAEGVRAALREDPDIIVIGELRDAETMKAAITAAETGHLVLATMHNRSALEAIGRIVHAFPSEKEKEIRETLAAVLRTVAAQTLWHREEETVLLREILINIPATAHIIREGRDPQLIGYMEMGRGMRTMRQAADAYTRTAHLSAGEEEALKADLGL